jgi:hypothetical protein
VTLGSIVATGVRTEATAREWPSAVAPLSLFGVRRFRDKRITKRGPRKGACAEPFDR